MKTKQIVGLSSVLFVSLASVTACSGTDARETLGTQKQALANGCRLPTVGAACDPDGDGPASACDGICTVNGAKDNEPECSPINPGSNEGMPCGGLEENKVECVRSCRGGVCVAGPANDDMPCMPSGSPYYSAVCEGACSAGTCIKLTKPKRCESSVEADSGAGASDDAGSSGAGDDTGSSGEEDTGSGGGDEDTGSSAEDTGSGGGGSGANGGSDWTLGGLDSPILSNTPAKPPAANIDAGTISTGSRDPVGVAADASPMDNGSCGCRTPGASAGSAPAAASLLAAIAIALRGRRRRQ